jgi:hypothetical protein
MFILKLVAQILNKLRLNHFHGLLGWHEKALIVLVLLLLPLVVQDFRLIHLTGQVSALENSFMVILFWAFGATAHVSHFYSIN